MISASMVGDRELQRWAQMAVRQIERDADKAIESTAKKLVSRAVTYAGGVGNSTRIKNSIKTDIKKSGSMRTLTFFADPKTPNIILPSGYNLTWMKNDGTYGNYSRGSISPTATTVGPVQGRKGMKHVDFMGRSWNLHIPKLQKKLTDILVRIK